jgi:hypothetical protein
VLECERRCAAALKNAGARRTGQNSDRQEAWQGLCYETVARPLIEETVRLFSKEMQRTRAKIRNKSRRERRREAASRGFEITVSPNSFPCRDTIPRAQSFDIWGRRSRTMRILTILVLAIAAGSVNAATEVPMRGAGLQERVAHGGGLDRNGCHNDHQRGGYHCH